MTCPVCEVEMNFMKEDLSTQNGKSYNRKMYFCLKDDCWVTVETAQKELA